MLLGLTTKKTLLIWTVSPNQRSIPSREQALRQSCGFTVEEGQSGNCWLQGMVSLRRRKPDQHLAFSAISRSLKK